MDCSARNLETCSRLPDVNARYWANHSEEILAGYEKACGYCVSGEEHKQLLRLFDAAFSYFPMITHWEAEDEEKKAYIEVYIKKMTEEEHEKAARKLARKAERQIEKAELKAIRKNERQAEREAIRKEKAELEATRESIKKEKAQLEEIRESMRSEKAELEGIRGTSIKAIEKTKKEAIEKKAIEETEKKPAIRRVETPMPQVNDEFYSFESASTSTIITQAVNSNSRISSASNADDIVSTSETESSDLVMNTESPVSMPTVSPITSPRTRMNLSPFQGLAIRQSPRSWARASKLSPVVAEDAKMLITASGTDISERKQSSPPPVPCTISAIATNVSTSSSTTVFETKSDIVGCNTKARSPIDSTSSLSSSGMTAKTAAIACGPTECIIKVLDRTNLISSHRYSFGQVLSSLLVNTKRPTEAHYKGRPRVKIKKSEMLQHD